MDREITRNPFDNKSPFDVLERVRRERLLHSISVIGIPAPIPVLVIYGLVWFSEPSWQIALAFCLTALLIGVCGLTLRLAQHHRAELGSYLLLSSTLFILGGNAVLVEGYISVLAIVYSTIIILAGMLLGPKGGYVFSGVVALFWALAQVAITSLVLPQAIMTSDLLRLTIMCVTVGTFLFIAFTSQLATQDLRRALNDATYDLVQANRKLEDASQLKSRFLARTSHELRTPLNAIIGYTDLTLRRVYGALTAMQEDGLKRVLANAKRLQTLINDILDLSKIEAGEMELAISPFVVSSLIEAVDIAVGETARKKGLEFSIDLESSMPEKIVGDEIRTAQILLNLADNAVKFTTDGQVGILIGPVNEDRWHMQVHDTGRGIAEEDYERIFDEFRQLNTAGDSRSEGSGLGLAIARHLVRRMGGEISVDSEIGKGSTFDVILPLQVAEKVQTQL
jgi:signal transduction histidine kinase